jgi:hypothetical protein
LGASPIPWREKMKKAVLALLLVPVVLMASATAEDEAEYKRWTLDIEYATPDWISMTDALGNPYLVWYQTIKLTNNTDGEVPLKVRLVGKTDSKKTYRGTIDPLAKKALEKETGKKFMSATEIMKGTLGSKKSIDAVVFYGRMDNEWDELNVRVTGLVDPIDKVDGKLYYEKKVLVLSYSRPGDEFERHKDEVKFKGSKWELAGERKEIPQVPAE